MKIKTILMAALLLTMGLKPAFSQIDNGGNWTPLFNGKNLDGWHQLNGHAKYTVEDGEIVGTNFFKTTHYFMVNYTKYGDIILELEIKVNDHIKTSIQIRSKSSTDYNDGLVHGCQIEISLSDSAYNGGIYNYS